MRIVFLLVGLLTACGGPATNPERCYYPTDAGVQVCRAYEWRPMPGVSNPHRWTSDEIRANCAMSGGTITNGCDAGTFGSCEINSGGGGNVIVDRTHESSFGTEGYRLQQAMFRCTQNRGQWVASDGG